MSQVQVRDAGDSGILLELEAVVDPDVNARAIAIAAALKDQRLAGVRDVIPTYRSVAVHFNPLTCDVNLLRDAMRQAAAAPPLSVKGSLVEVPVAYGADNGPDLDEVAAFAKLPPKTVIDRHSGPEYRVFMLGFLPGFAYMGIVDESIAAPRKATPRTRIPAGSVGIAGRQTGVYPRESPGGWQVIGRTPLQLFDPDRKPASLFAPGDRVRFLPGFRDPGRNSHAEARTTESRITESRISNPESRSITVLTPGLFTTVQDAGRWGHQDRGVPVSGPMDWRAYRVANALVGNALDAAMLEVTLLGPEVRFDGPAVVAVTGADLGASIDGEAVAVNSACSVANGSVLRFGERRFGTRAYVAIDGGIDVPPVLGSRSTHVISALGGLDGRALRAGDRLAVGASNDQRSGLSRQRLRLARQLTDARKGAGGARLRMMRGPQDYYFAESTYEWLQRGRFTISPQSNRMGYRLIAASGNAHLSSSNRGSAALFGSGEMISDATFIGGIQIPPSGSPILLMADRQTTGGYPQIATVITADLPLAGQLAPGDWIEFAPCTRQEALAALREQHEAFGAG